jgi:acetylornithine deacetylase
MSVEERVRVLLAELVAFDTQNPHGDDGPIAETLAAKLRALGAARTDVFAAGKHHGVYAVFGASPRLLLNAHVDTVPANLGFTSPPLALLERGGRLHGLGAADTKGAIAAILAAIESRRAANQPIRDVAVLFSGDEESGGSVMRRFLGGADARGITNAIVCEPTGCRVGVRHRGIGAARAVATSPGGHSSRADHLPAPVAVVARAAVALDAWGRRRRAEGPAGFEGLCVNIAAIDGGIAFNVVPSRAALTVSFRPWPGADVAALHREAEAEARAAASPDPLAWEVTVSSPPLSTPDVSAFAPLLAASGAGPADLQFWTEAALLSAAGIQAIVFGPGDIAQAHAPDEYVEVAQLVRAHDAFVHMLSP